MTGEELRALGEAVLGPTWQARLSAGLPMSVRNVRRLTTGERSIHAALEADILALLRASAAEARAAIDEYEARRER